MAAENVYTCFMESLKNRMAMAGVTQVDLARSVETSKTHFNTVYKGRKRAGAKLQKRLASYFGTSLEAMVQEGYNLLHEEQPAREGDAPDRPVTVQRQVEPSPPDQESGSLTDVALHLATGVKKMQDHLAKWQSTIEAIGDGVVVISAKTQKIEYHNQAHQDLFGGNSIGMKCSDVAGCPFKGEGPSSRAMKTGRVVRDRISHNGKTISIVASPIRDASGRIVRVVTTSRDVTDQQQNLENIVTAEERLMGVISMLGLPVLIFDEKNRLVYSNEVVRELINATDQDLVDLETLTECLRSQMKDFDRLELWLRKTATSRELLQINVEYNNGRQSVWTSKPIFSPTGRFLGRIGIGDAPKAVGN